MAAANPIIGKPIISADSHIMEPPGTYIDRIDRKYSDSAPRVVSDTPLGDIYVIDGMDDTIPMGLVAAGMDLCNPRRLMWANDFPHSDSTWPHSQELLQKHTGALSDEHKTWLLHDNVAELYGLASAARPSGGPEAR